MLQQLNMMLTVGIHVVTRHLRWSEALLEAVYVVPTMLYGHQLGPGWRQRPCEGAEQTLSSTQHWKKAEEVNFLRDYLSHNILSRHSDIYSNSMQHSRNIQQKCDIDKQTGNLFQYETRLYIGVKVWTVSSSCRKIMSKIPSIIFCHRSSVIYDIFLV